MDTPPSTMYAMLGDHCHGACTFCTQARDNAANRKYLSRVIWPEFNIDHVVTRINNNADIRRICIQTLKAPDIFTRLPKIVERLHEGNNIPISVCMNPAEKPFLVKLKNAGAERVGTGLDCATMHCFENIKPGFSWDAYQQFIKDTIDVFGRGSVHLIVGLGDSDEDLVLAFQRYTDMGCSIGLFALTPMPGTKLHYPAPSIERYRALQLSRYLISTKQSHVDRMLFLNGKLISVQTSEKAVNRIYSNGIPFRTSGCPDCNRPNYNERPGGVMYNYAEPLDETQISQAIKELLSYISIENIS
jgi:biotin synthase